MRKLLIVCVSALVLSMNIAHANELETHEGACSAGTNNTTHLLGRGLCVSLGLGIGFLGHELAHKVVGGGDIKWYQRKWACEECSGKKVRRISIAGFTEQILTTEILLGVKEIPSEHPVIVGVLMWNILDPLYYTWKSERNDGHGDLANFDRSNRRIIESAIVGHALFSTYRLLYRDDRFPLFITATGKELGVFLRFSW